MNDTLQADLAKHCMELEQRLSEANARMAMMEEALKEADEYYHFVELGYVGQVELKRKLIRALSTSPESLKKWEADKLEPLQKQVAMLTKLLDSFEYNEYGPKRYPSEDEVYAALSNNQTTAEAFMREHDAKVKSEFATWLCAQTDVQRAAMHYVADSVRAANKE